MCQKTDLTVQVDMCVCLKKINHLLSSEHAPSIAGVADIDGDGRSCGNFRSECSRLPPRSLLQLGCGLLTCLCSSVNSAA